MNHGEGTFSGKAIYTRCRTWRRLLIALPVIAAFTLLFCSIAVPRAAAKTFAPTTDMTATRYGHTVTLLPNGKVLITGGFDNTCSLKTAEIYDPATGTISPTSEMNAPRMDHSATLLVTGKVLISGGRNGTIDVNTAEIYDPATGKFMTTSGNSLGRIGHSATLLPSGKVLIAGGVNENSYVGTAEIYDPETGIVAAAPGMVAQRQGHSATPLHNGRVLIVGGMKDNSYVNNVEIYDPVAGTFSAVANLGSGRYAHTATLLSDGRVLIAGGRNGSGIVSSAEIFDPATGSFTSVSNMASERDDHTATLMPDGTVLIAGGRDARGYLNTAEVFDPQTGVFIPTVNMTSIRDISSAILLPNSKVLVAGGWDGTSAARSAEIFDPEIDQKFRLHLNTVGKGEGSVVFTPGKSCSGSCSQFYAGGTAVTLTPVLNSASVFLGWSGCDSVVGNDCIVSMTKNRHVKLKTVDAETDDGSPAYGVTATSGVNGGIAPPGTTLVQRGDNIAYTITPAPGYHVADVLVDGHRDLGPVTTFTFTKVKKTHTISASFAPNNAVTITAGAGPNGTISPSAEVLVPSGAGQDFTITPAAGYQVADVLMDGASVGAVTSYIFSSVTADHTILASFTPIVYTITATAGVNGSLDPAGVSSVNSGVGQDYTITPAAGFKVADVLVDGISVGAVTTYNFSTVTAIHVITASFSPIVFTITATAGSNGAIAPAGVSSINSGSGQDYTITPAIGFKVADVQVDGVSVGAVTAYSFSTVTASHAITASFTPIVYTITATAGANGSIIPTGGSSVNHGAAMTCAITPAVGFKVADVLVDGVSVGAVTTYSFSTVTASHAITASFSHIVHEISATAGANGGIDPAGISSVNQGAGLSFVITPAIGFKVADVLVDGVSVGALTTYSFSNVTASHAITASFTPIVYTITATAGANGSINPAGAGSVNHGAAMNCAITPATGFKVADVLIDDVSVGALTTYSFSSVTTNHTISASFVPIVYAVTASAGANGSIDPAGVGSVNHGAGLTYAITPAAGFKVADVLVDGTGVGAVTTYSFSNIMANHAIAASFTPIVHEINATAGANGSIGPVGISSINHGSTQTFTITPTTGFKVADVLVDGISVGAATSYSFSNVTAGHSISVSFTPIVYTVTATAGANGSIDPAGAGSVNYGAGLSFTIAPSAGFRIADVLIDGVSVGAVSSYSFSNVTADHSISSSFAPIVYTVTATAGANGSITPAAESSVNHGFAQVFTITPAAGFKVADVLVDGVSVGAASSYSFSNVTANHSISVSFAQIVYSATASAGANGSILPVGESTVSHGGGLTYAITPAAGFKVADVLVDGVSAGAVTTYSFSNVTANLGISASFTPIVYTVSAAAGANGSITPAGTNSVNHGAGLTYTITPAANYQVADVLVDNISVGAVTTYTFNNVTAGHTISATFSQIIIAHTISASAGANGSIAPAGNSSVNSGDTLTYTITPAAGYKIAAVLVDNISVGAVTTYTFSNVTADHTISATFVSARTITATTTANGSIDPVGLVTVANGGSQTFTITPAPGYKVSTVRVDSTYMGAITSYTFTNVTANHTITPYFVPITYPISATAGANGTVTPAGTASVNQGTNKTYTITPAPGYHIVDVLVDDASVGAVTTYAFTGVAAAHTISATFAANPTVTITANAGPNGTISPAGDVSLLGGTNQTFTFTAAAGYRVADVLADGVSKGAVASYTFANVTGNHTIAVTFTPDVFTLAAVAMANGSIDPAGVTTVARGGSQVFTIIPAPGYKVSTVRVDSTYMGAITSYTFTNVTANHTITPYFVPITHTITATAGTNGAVSPAGTATVNQGTNKTYTFTPTVGYHVVDVLVDDASVGAVTTYTFTSITATHTISATFATNPTVTITASAGPNGSISPAGDVSMLSGVNQTYTFTPAAGYRVGDVLVDGVSMGAAASFTFTNVTAYHAIGVTFTPDLFSITATTSTNGSIEPGGAITFARGVNQTYTITPAPGYQVSIVIVDGAGKGAITSYTFSNITANHTITALFAPITHTISATAGANGTVTPAGTATANQGTNKTYTITPAPGYHIADVLVDNASVGAVSTYTFTNITAPHTISATFASNPTVTITATAGPSGSISPAGDVTMLSGASHAFTFTPAAGYRVGDVLVDGVSMGGVTSYTFTGISATNHTISVTFTLDTFVITATAMANGSIDPAGVTTVARGGSQTYTITPAPGYKVSTVSVDSTYMGAITSYTFTNVTANHTITPYFVPITHTISATAGANGAVSPAGTASVNQGTNKTYTITPTAGYHIADVLVDDASVGAVTTYTFAGVTAAHTISATFAANPTVTITASAGLNGSISPAGDVSMLSGASQTYTFTPAAGYRVADVLVDGVSKGATSSYTFTGISATNHTISVTFALDTFVITATAMVNGSIDPAGVTTVARGGSQTYTITPAPGYKVSTVRVDSTYMGAITSYTFSIVTANHTITPYFAQITYPITASSGANGIITPTGTVNVMVNSSKSYTITPEVGYHVEDVLVDDASVGAVTSYTFDNVTVAHSISATFAANPAVAITASAESNGSISPEGTVAVLSGVNKTFTISPAYGYRVADLLVDGASAGAVSSYTFTNVATDHTIQANFTLDVFTISATTGANGSIDPVGVATLNRGDGIAYTITPASGYKVLNVLVDGVYQGELTSYTFNNVTANHTISPTFALIQ